MRPKVTDRHSLNAVHERPLPDGPLTDEDLARLFYRSHAWRRWRKFMRWPDLETIVRKYLREQTVFATKTGIEFESAVQRILHVVRSNNALKGVAKRRKTLASNRQDLLFPDTVVQPKKPHGNVA
jgi:hypothetical protein